MKNPVKLISYVTDMCELFSFWVEKEADLLCVASDGCYQQLMDYKVDKSKVMKIPYPIRNQFSQDYANKKVRLFEEYKLNINYPTVLASDGGEGIGNLYKYVKEIYYNNIPINVFVVCGKNIYLFEKFSRLIKSKRSRTRLVVLEFVKNMNELLDICDFAVGKAGPATVYESLIKNKPIIISGYALQHEKATMKQIADNNFGCYVKNKHEFLQYIKKFIDKDELEKYKESIRKANLVSGADQMARLIVDRMEKNS
jgi:processive 1,2-diacylglycerol beta-glucosyltransferase/1,2-diacylglycerol 3-beta-galactosyltransferase